MEQNKQQLTYPLDFPTQEVLFDFLKTYFLMGFIAPSYTTAQRDVLVAKAGMVILNTTTGKLNFYTGSGWEAITSA